MKIMHLCLSLGKGGAEKLLVDSLPFYVNQGHEVRIIQLSSILEEPTYIESVENAGIKVITLSNGGFRNLKLIQKLMQAIRSEKPDVLHVHLFPCLYFASIASRLMKNFPVMVFTEHNNQNRRMTKGYLQPIENFMYARYNAIVAISGNVAAMLRNWLPSQINKIRIIENGVNVEKFTAAEPYDVVYFSKHFNLQENNVKLFMASRFNYQKDQQTIIRALELLPHHFHVFLAGDGPEMGKAQTLANELQRQERVHFLGFRTDIPKLMKSADINILSSFFEGFSGVTLEALSSGKPFLGSDVPGINDIVPDKSFLFEKENPKQLAGKIMAITTDKDLNQTMVSKGLNHIKQYDMQIMVDRHVNLYENLLRPKN
ncbi:MAG TPA: glycosyltransferase [Flavobacterium sp.]|nr:glycosyltransferase [Flavobacterium sp.]